jgi:hypothetical protein
MDTKQTPAEPAEPAAEPGRLRARPEAKPAAAGGPTGVSRLNLGDHRRDGLLYVPAGYRPPTRPA